MVLPKILVLTAQALGSPMHYVWDYNATHNCDAETLRLRNPMRYVNSVASADSCGRQNLQVHIDDGGIAPVVYVATTDIQPGEVPTQVACKKSEHVCVNPLATAHDVLLAVAPLASTNWPPGVHVLWVRYYCL